MPETLGYQVRNISGPARWLTRGGRWLKRNFTRENIVQALKTLASIGPLTILIWIYAEREQIQHEPKVPIPIEIRSTNPDLVVSLRLPHGEHAVTADLDGPASTIRSLMDRLESHGDDQSQAAIEILVDPQLTPGRDHEIDTAAALASNAAFRGITVSNCNPDKLDVYVDTVERRELEVQASAGITNLVGPPVFTPRTVNVSGPKEAVDALENAHKLVAEADLGGFDAMNIPGSHEFPVVRIKPLEDVTFAPPNVAATVSVRESDVTGTIRSVPIWVGGPPDLMARYRVDLSNPVLTNVKVTGPADKIDLVNSPDFSPRPHALLEIHYDDEAGKPLERVLRFDLPPGFGLHVDEAISQQKIGFKLVDAHPTE